MDFLSWLEGEPLGRDEQLSSLRELLGAFQAFGVEWRWPTFAISWTAVLCPPASDVRLETLRPHGGTRRSEAASGAHLPILGSLTDVGWVLPRLSELAIEAREARFVRLAATQARAVHAMV